MKLITDYFASLIILIVGFLSAYFYYQQLNEEILSEEITKYESASTLGHERLLKRLENKKNLLDTLVKYVQMDDDYQFERLQGFSNIFFGRHKIHDICEINLNKNTFRSIKHGTDHTNCYAFDLLLDSRVYTDSSFKIYFSQHVMKQDTHLYISIIISEEPLLESQVNFPYNSNILFFNNSENSSINIDLKTGETDHNQSLKTDHAITSNYYPLGMIGDIETIYFTSLTDDQIPINRHFEILLITLLIIIISLVLALYVNNILKAHKGIEFEVKEKTKELEYSENFLELVTENNPDYIFVKDESFRITLANKNFMNLYPEDKRHQIIGSTTLEEYPQQEADAFLEMDKKAFSEGVSETLETVTFPDANQRILNTKKIRFLGPDNNYYILGISRDVTEREILIKKLEHSNDELNQFAYRTSHDLKAPITTIKRLGKFISQDIQDGEYQEAISNLDKVDSECIKLIELVTDILDISRAEKDSANMSETTNLTHLIEELIEKHHSLIDKNGVTISNNIQRNTIIQTEKTRIYQILENLLTNAVKYSDPNKKSRYVQINSVFDKDHIKLVVRDNGVGIPANAGEKIFDLFSRYHPEKAEGSGIGLAILKKHIDKLQGYVTVENLKDGTRFTVTLPKVKT